MMSRGFVEFEAAVEVEEFAEFFEVEEELRFVEDLVFEELLGEVAVFGGETADFRRLGAVEE